MAPLLGGIAIIGHTASDRTSLALVLSAIGVVGLLIHLAEHELADPASGAKLDRQRIGIVEFERDVALKSGIDPAGVLNEQTEPTDGTPTLDESCEIVGQLHPFHGRGQNKGVGRKGDLIALELPVADLGVEVDRLHVEIIDNQKVVAQAAINGSRLNALLDQGLDDKVPRLQHRFEGPVRQNQISSSLVEVFGNRALSHINLFNSASLTFCRRLPFSPLILLPKC